MIFCKLLLLLNHICCGVSNNTHIKVSRVVADYKTWADRQCKTGVTCLNISLQMTQEYSSDDDERLRGRSSSDLTPDDYDFDIGNYSQQNNFFNRLMKYFSQFLDSFHFYFVGLHQK